MSKAALDQFTRTTALELAPQQVRCNAVNPGVIRTEIHKRGGMSKEDYDKVRQFRSSISIFCLKSHLHFRSSSLLCLLA